MEVRQLGREDEPLARRLVAADPVSHVFVAGRLDAGLLDRRVPGRLLAYPAHDPRALLHVGSNLVTVSADREACRAFAEQLPDRGALSIVGPSEEAMALWGALGASWGRVWSHVREVRPAQPVMVLRGEPAVPSDPRVHLATSGEFASYFSAAVDMYTEEVGADPLEGNAWGYRRHVQGLINDGHAYAIVHAGRVVFKTDVGNAAGGVAQLQGVWIDPEFRGRGWAAPAVAAVCRLLAGRFHTISLYVNDFNVAAIATYQRAGFRFHNEFATVLY